MADDRAGDRHAETPLTVRFSKDRHTPVRRVVRDAVRHWLDKHTSPDAGNGETRGPQ